VAVKTTEGERKRKPEDPELAAIKRIRGILEELTPDRARRVVANTSDWWSERVAAAGYYKPLPEPDRSQTLLTCGRTETT
jgi:hypothetical protein